MEAPPTAAFEMSEPDLLLELLIVPLDAPAQLRRVDQIRKGNVLRKGRKPVFGRLAFALRPLDQQPFFGSTFRQPIIAMRRANTQARKARKQRFGRALTPFDRSPGPLRQAERKQPPKAAFVTRLQPFRLPGRAARQLPNQSTTLWVESSSTDDSRLRGALPAADLPVTNDPNHQQQNSSRFDCGP